MTNPQSDLLDKIRQQFDSSPYPRIPIDKSPKDSPNELYIHNLVTSFYLRDQRVIDTKGKVILDAGCGSGYKSLILAEANPGAKIVGVDISAESIKLAEQRLKYHGFDNAEFYVLSIEELSSLNYQFDYINCDELLYLFPDPVCALTSMKSLLNPSGIIRSNLHSFANRANIYRAQKMFAMMGLMDENPEELEIEVVIETMQALKDHVLLKTQTWNPSYTSKDNKVDILMNYLFQGDKGYTISDMFIALELSGLEFISMVNWREWDIRDLFKEVDNLPIFWEMSLPDLSVENRLKMYEFLNPIHRLLDFWCGHPQQIQTFIPSSTWNDFDWHKAKVYLHPQLNTSKFREDLAVNITDCGILSLDKYLSTHQQIVTLDSSMATCLFPLLDAPQTIMFLVERWKQFRPVDPVTLQPIDRQTAFNLVKNTVMSLESLDYLMLEL
ncbi:class I SAM-dependent methyltransferase [Pseudanabaena sp. UWO310]|uniref:class I SAM-dependent methyltransferase n=1 Tax=Pseudanabaena sp. UWO310 TaxID=2480795 RepID=UPI0011575D29|nr:class I SAM-dependent methyltransferase [Pseudanabaena sp. UWO310]TYQ31667.1 class I SAM-dependent methyltransferase [Pseudanabaena sp. UWO310]